MPILPNFLTPQEGEQNPEPDLINAFRHHFHGSVDVGGTEPEFSARWDIFKYNYIDASLKYAQSQQIEPLCDSDQEIIVNDLAAQVDNLYTLVLGIGQLAVAWELIPTPVEASPEDSPQVVSVTSSSKGKTREARRFTHVLSNLIAKNFKGPGPHGIPKEAVKDVKGEDVMVAEMIAAMADKSEILDFADTKPYKDHWKNMHKPEFRRLARTLFYHLNELHQGVDFTEGFRYADRYRNLISLLKSCKGTIYFMSRPSTYEDVILNPHMMQLRFADNQKNNAKKKVDNRELTARRNSEFVNLHGCNPPPKGRASKGRKRAASTMNDNEDEASSSSSPARPAVKRQKAAPRNGKTAASRAGAVSRAEEGSSAEQAVDVPVDSPTFSGEPDQDSLEYCLPQEQDIYVADQQQLYLSPQQNQQYYSPPQNTFAPQQQLKPGSRKSGSRGQKRVGPKEPHPQAVALGSNPGPVSLADSMDISNDVESQVLTVIASDIQSGNYTANPLDSLDSTFSDGMSAINHQVYQPTGFYQTLYPDISISGTSKVVPVHDQVAQFHSEKLLRGQYKQPEAEHTSPGWHVPVNQGFKTQRALHCQLQHMTAVAPNDTKFDARLDPYWGSEEVTDLGGFTNQEIVDPQQIFDQTDFVQLQGNNDIGANLFEPDDTNAPGFGDLDLDFEDPDLGFCPFLQTATPLPNAGGQAVRRPLGGQSKMKEMEAMMAADP